MNQAKILLITLFISFAFAQSAYAQKTLTWKSTSSTAWATAANWYDEGTGLASTTAPASTDIVSINNTRGATAQPAVTTAAQVCKTLTVGSGFVLSISGATGALTVGDGSTGNNDITIQNGGEIDMLSTAGSGNPFTLSNTSNDKLRLDSGGKLVWNTGRGFATPFPAAQCDFDNASTVEFGQSVGIGLSISGRSFGNLTISATSARTQTGSVGAANAFNVNGTLTLGTNASFTLTATTSATVNIGAISVASGTTLSFSTSTSPITIGGNIANNGTITNSSASESITFNGNTTISGSAVTFTNGLTVNATKTLATGVAVNISAGKTATINGTFQINASGWGGSTGTYSYGSSGALVFNSGGTYGHNGTDTYWPTTNPPNVTIQNSTTVTMPTADRTAVNVTIASGSTLALNGTSNDLHVTGNWSNAGTFTSNGRAVWFEGTGAQSITNASGENFAYLLVNKVSGTLSLANNATVTFTAGDGLQLLNAGGLDLNTKTLTLAGAGGNIKVSGAARTLAATTSGTLAITGAKTVTSASSGTLVLPSTLTVLASAGIDFGASLTTLNGTLQLNAGGFVSNNAPTYGSAALLKYNTGGTFGRTAEWSSSPANVQLSNNTTLNYPNGVSITKTMTGTLTIDAGSSFYMDYGSPNPGVGTLTVGGNVVLNGNLSLGNLAGGDLQVAGNWTRTGVLTPNGRQVEFNGSSAQSLTGTTTFDYLAVNNSAGLTLNNNAIVNTALTLTSGKITTGANSVVLGSAAGVSGAAAGKYVYGNLAYTTAASGTPTVNFTIGDATNYTPVSVTINSLTGSGTITAATTSGAHPQIGSAPAINSSKSVARYWTLTNSGTTFSNYSATYTFVPGDLVGSPTTANFIVGKYNGSSWSYPTVGTKTSTSTQVTGVTSFSDFAVGEQQTYTVTATAASNGTISPNGATTVNYGNNQAYTIAANSGYHIDSVVVDGSNQGAVSSYTFTNVTSNHTINSYYSITTYTITATAAANGSISPSGAVSVNSGSNQAFTISANTGYHIDSVVVDGANQGAITSYTFTNVTAAHSINSYYTINSYTITATAAANGTITPNGATSVNYGGSQGYTIAANSGYHIDSVVVDGANQGAITSYTFSSVVASHTINSYYSINTYTITATAAANGSISPSGAVSVNYGSGQAFTIAANTGYHIDSVVVDGSNQGAVTSYTFTNVTANHSINSYYTISTYTITATAAANGTISPNGATSVNYGGNQAYTISANTGYHIDSVVVDGANQGAISSYTFSSVAANHSINSYYTINSYSITASAGANGSISPSGTVSANYGANQAFTISANSNYHIDSVVVDGVDQGPVGSYTFNSVATNHSINAYFSIDNYTITAVAAANGTISPSGSVSVIYGANQTFTITPNTGYHIDSVVVDGIDQGAIGTYTFTSVSTNHTIHSYYTINSYTITATAAANGSISPAGSVSVNHGANQAFSISANSGYHIDSVVVDGSNQGAVSSYTFTNVTASHSINSYYSINTYTITATAAANGSISPSGAVSVNHGSNQSFTISANTGYHIDSVVVDGANQGAVTSYTFTNVTAAHTINSYYSIDTYTITATAGANGSITPNGAVSVNYGANQSFTIAANSGYHIDSVVVDGSNLGAISSHTFNTVTANHTIDAYFSINAYTITATAAANGSISPSGAVSVNSGSNQAFSISANSGYHIDSVVVDGANQGAVTSYTFTNVTANHSIDAYYSINTYTITATVAANGSISPSGSVSVNHGANQAFTISANTGYHIDSVVVDGANQGAVSSYTFTNVTATHTINSYYSIDTYTITATAGANGSITPSGAVSVNYGATQAFTIGANSGYHIDSVLVDGSNIGAVTSQTFVSVIANHTVDAYFSVNAYVITASAGANGSISPSGSVGVGGGSNQAFTITANTGYHIDSVVVDGVDQGALSTYTFTSVGTNHTISAYFGINSYTITATAAANGTISPNGATSVNYGGSQAYTIAANSGYHIDSVVVDGANQGAVASYTFSSVAANHTIHSYYSINQYAITSTASAGGSITPSGSTQVSHGGSQAYTIAANTGYHIDSVLVDGASQGAVTSYTFSNVTATHSINAYFSIDQFVITATAAANGSISPNGATSVNYGASQAFTITANTGYHIDSVLVNGVTQGAVSSYTFTNVTAAHTIDAYFSIDQFTITATAAANGTISPNGATTVNYNGLQAYTIAANTGYHIDSVLVDGATQGAVTAYTFSNVTANHTIHAYFSIDQFTITATAEANGTISPNGSTSVNYNGSQAFTIAANTGYHIDSVLVDGISQGAISSYTFSTVTANHSIHSYYSIDQFTITSSAAANGSITPSGSTTVNYGASQAYSISASTGYHVDSVVVDGSNQGAVSSYTFTNVTANHSIAAHFSIDQFTITATAAATGSISPAGATTVSYGGSQAYTISANTGYHIDSVVVDGANQGAISSHTFTTVTANHTINAYFSIDQFTITSSAAANGSISPSGSTTVNYGASQAYTITANTGYHIDSVVVDGANQGAISSHTFTNVTANHAITAYFSIDQFTITSSAAANGSISPSGSTTVNYGGGQAYTITANTGYHIDSVVVDGTNQGALSSYTFSNVTANHSIAAHFSIDQFTITATAAANGTITPSGVTTVSYGGSQAYTISANTGYHIDSVVVDGANQGAVTSHTFSTVTANHTIHAYFSIDQFTITATAAANGTITPVGAVTVNYGSNQSFTIAANTGYHIDSVVVDGSNVGALSSHTFTSVTANHTINAYFSIDQFTITATAAANGSISPVGATTVNYGGSQAYTISANTGYHIDSVVVDGGNIGAVTTHTFSTVTASHTIHAYFSIDQFTISATAAANGSISPAGATTVSYGGSQAYAISANTGYHIDSVVVDGANQGAISSHTFTTVTANHTIHAYFSIDQFTVTATAAANGTITPAGAVTVNYGSNQSFTIAANTGYHIDSVIVDGSNVGALSSHTFTSVTANHSIYAYFSIDQFTITATAAANGSISPAGATTVNYGGSQAYTITPNTGYHIDSVVVDAGNIGAVATHTFSSVTASHSIHAYFSIDQFTITATAAAHGSVTPAGATTVSYGNSQAYTIAANTGYHIDSVQVDGVNQGAIAAYTFTNVTATHSIHAYFSIDQFTITSTAAANGTITPLGATTVNYGANQAYTIAPATGYHIDSVLVDGVTQGAIASYTFSSVVAGHTIAAYFSINTYTITVTAGANGTITPTGPVTVSYGASQAFTLAAGTGYHIDSVHVDGVNQGVITSYTFTNVTASHTIQSYVSIDQFTITATATSGGTMTPSGAVIVNYGSNRSFAIAPTSGYHLDSVLVDGAKVDSTTSYTFHTVTAAHSIAAFFTINTFTVTPFAGPNGTISPPIPVVLPYGGSTSFIFTPDSHYHVDSILVNGVLQPRAPAYTFTNVTSNKTIRVTFAIDSFTITSTAGANGTTSPAGIAYVPYGGSQTVTFLPDAHYSVDSFSVDGVIQPVALSYTFTAVSANHTVNVSFRDQTSALTQYRTFTYESMQVKTPVKRTAGVGYFEFVIKDSVHAPASLISLNFKVNVDSITFASGLSVQGSKRRWTLTGSWTSAESLVIHGWTSKANSQQINQFYYGPVHGRARFTNVKPRVERFYTLMPNTATIRDAAFGAGVFGSGMVVGLEMTGQNSSYGWVKIPKTDLFFKSMVDGSVRHTALRGFNFRAAYNSLSPKRYNDRFFADLAILKLNIGISSIGMTPAGLGELLYIENGSPYDRMLVSDIAAEADTLLTLNKGHAYSEYVALDSVLRRINRAFYGVIDTVSSSDSLVLTGVRPLADVPYLTASGLAPKTIHPIPTPEAVDPIPTTMTLEQNYPNPFNPTTTIRFALPDQMNVTLKVYNMLGQEVATLLNNQLTDEGSNEISVNASNWASGVYFYRIEAVGLTVENVDPESGDVTQSPAMYTSVKKMLLIR